MSDVSDQRRYYERMMDKIATEHRQQIDQLETENAKLRELVRIAIEYCVNGYCAEEDGCPLYESRHSCRLNAEARELGIGVE